MKAIKMYLDPAMLSLSQIMWSPLRDHSYGATSYRLQLVVAELYPDTPGDSMMQ